MGTEMKSVWVVLYIEDIYHVYMDGIGLTVLGIFRTQEQARDAMQGHDEDSTELHEVRVPWLAGAE